MKTAATVLSLCLMMSFTVWSQATSNDTTTDKTFEVFKTSKVCAAGENDTVAVLSADQLRTTALIFAEHEFLQQENTLLKEQVNTLQQSADAAGKMITGYQTALRELEQNHAAAKNACEAIVESCREEVERQKKKTRRRTVMGVIGGVVVGVLVGGVVF